MLEFLSNFNLTACMPLTERFLADFPEESTFKASRGGAELDGIELFVYLHQRLYLDELRWVLISSKRKTYMIV